MGFYKNYKYVIECDESHLNQSKLGALTRTGRVQADQVWVWGATLPRGPQRFVFRVHVEACPRCRSRAAPWEGGDSGMPETFADSKIKPFW